MMRSMFSGVSGLRAHQTRMDVIGNNVANVNTVGFKSGRVTFQEVFAQTLQGAGAPDAATGRGGTNPMQVGLGLGVGSIDTLMTRGSLQRTDNPTDLSIEGDGFFVVRGGSGDTFSFTRAGNFGLDKLGNLVAGGGMNVYGWQAYSTGTDGSYTFDTELPIEPINLYADDHNLNKRMIAAKATQNIVLAGNLDAAYTAFSTDPDAKSFTVPMTVYDSLGNDYKINIVFQKSEETIGTPPAPSTSTWTWSIPSDTSTPSKYTVTMPTTPAPTITFDNTGKITAATTTLQTVTITPAAAAAQMSIDLDFSKITMYAGDSSVKPSNIDGYPSGNLVTFNVGADGILTGIYSNGQQQPLGMIALAYFTNPAGLQKIGDNLYIPTTNSGDFNKALKAGSEGVGTLNPGTLEMSNVDLSKEFTDMIITQRGFQANSRIITTSDEMLQELVNLKR